MKRITTIRRVVTSSVMTLLLLSHVAAAKAQTPQAIWTADNTTLTFIYGPQYAAEDTFNDETVTAVWSGTDVTATGDNAPGWSSVASSITTVVFAPNFESVRPTSLYGWFYGCEQLKEIKGMNYLNTSKVTSMSDMFRNCSSLTSLDVSKFDTRNVTTMSSMFFYCIALTSLDVSKFDTSNVTNMSSMFYYCSALTSLDVSNFKTSKVTDMSTMFKNCSALTSLDVSKFDTSNVTDMAGMFDRCSNLTSLDVSNFYTSNVTKMSTMFSLCSDLTSLDVSNFDTRRVTAMSSMFYGCSSLTSLDLSNFDTSNVTQMSMMFNSCSSLTTIFCNDTWEPTTSSKRMFYKCTRLRGGAGTAFGSSHIDATYAHPDGGSANPGYFTLTTKNITGNRPGDKETYWTTYYNGGIHTQVIPAEGQTLTVYTAKLEEVEGVRQLTLTTVADNIIMAGQGVIIESSQSDVTLKHSASLTPTGSYYSENELKGRDHACDVPTNEGTIYTMGNVDGKLGFYKYTGSQLKARRAYLAIPAGSEAGIRIRFDGEDTATGIDEVQSTTDKVQSATIYDLQGRRVVNPTKGIYIVNGKKVYMK